MPRMLQMRDRVKIEFLNKIRFESLETIRGLYYISSRLFDEIHVFLLKIIFRDRFPYYKSNDDRWKNSVRHNLSINPHFRKGNKAKAGAGHLWKISSRESEANFLAWEHVRLFRKLSVSPKVANSNVFDSEETAPGTLLQDGSRKSAEATGGKSQRID